MAEIPVDVQELIHGVTINVKLENWRIARFRLWLCVQIMKFAALVGGFGGLKTVSVSEDTDANET